MPTKDGKLKADIGLEKIRRQTRERVARWRKANPERAREIDRRYREKHLEYIRERNKIAERARRAWMKEASQRSPQKADYKVR